MLGIVIPYYKRIYFEGTLSSLANQSDKRFRVYIGDDASSENPSDLLQEYFEKVDIKYFRFDENMGGTSLVKQWQRCISMTEDEQWIMILGDDDYLDESVVASFYKNLELFNSKSNVIRFASRVINEKLNSITDSFIHPKWEAPSASYFRRFKEQTRSSLSEYIFSRSAYQHFGFQDYPLAWHSDDNAWLDFSDGMPIYTINESNVYIRISDTSISGKTDNNELKSQAAVLFLKNVITQRIKSFKKKERLELLLAFEIEIKKSRKLNLNEWVLLTRLYAANYKFVPFSKVIRRFFISFIYK
jgi:glycosyltransferase involved in cell wall biosynthesis